VTENTRVGYRLNPGKGFEGYVSFGELGALHTPICPKCGKVISPKKYKRHLGRCGSRHKLPPKPLDHPENFYMKI
jgi:ribosomal protein S27AE